MTSTGPKEALFPSALVPFAARVERRIDDLLVSELARWKAVDERLADPIEALRGFVANGGERLRPAFCYCAFIRADGEASATPVVCAAAAPSLVHTSALPHDDATHAAPMPR